MTASRSKIIVRGFVAWAFSIALGLLFVLVLRALSAQISPPPELSIEPYPDTSTQVKCEAEGGRWIETAGQVRDGAVPRPVSGDSTPYCQGPLAFERAQTLQREKSQQTSLFVFAVGGGLAVAGALLLPTLRAVAPGLMLGGIVAFLVAGFYVWTLAPGIGRLLTIIAVFVVLAMVGMHVFRDQEK